MYRLPLLLAFVTGIAWTAVDDDVVGALDLQRMQVVIADGPTFPPEEIITALYEDPELLPARHFFAERKLLLKAIAERSALGYRAHGFRDPQITAQIRGRGPGEQVVVHITEGQRLRWGALHIRDAGPVPAAAVFDRLTKPWREPDASAGKPKEASALGNDLLDALQQKSPDDPLFVSGDPAHFDHTWAKRVTSAISEFYVQQGYLECRPVVTVGDPNDGVVDCVVSFSAPPHAVTVKSVTVSGLTVHKPEDVTVWLDRTVGLRAGGPATKSVFDAARAALVDSGSFLATSLTSVPVPGQPELCTVTITAIDDADLLQLGRPPTDLQQDILRWRKLMLQDLQDGTATVTFQTVDHEVGYHFTIMINVRHGVIVTIRSTDPKLTFSGSFLVHSGHLTYVAHRLKRVVAVPMSRKPSLRLELFTTGDRKNPNSINFLVTDAEEQITHLSMTPSFALLQVANVMREGDRLIKLQEKSRLEIDLGPQGTLPYQRTDSEDNNITAITRQPWPELLASIQVDPGAVKSTEPASFMDLLLVGAEDAVPVISKTTSVNQLVISEWLSTCGPVVKKWWQRWEGKTEKTAGEHFHIPVDLPPSEMMSMLITWASSEILSLASTIWPVGSWPVLVVNELRAIATGHGDHSRELFGHLLDGKTMGPIGHVVLAGAMRFLNPRAGLSIANLGLDHLQMDEWVQDLITLSPTMPALKETFAAFNDPVTAAFLLPKEHRFLFIALVARAKLPLTPAEEREFERNVASLFWMAGGEQLMRDLLTYLSTPPAATGADSR